MTRFPSAASGEETLFAAPELSKNSWLLAIQIPERDNPSLHPITGGDAEGLMAKLDGTRERLGVAPSNRADTAGVVHASPQSSRWGHIARCRLPATRATPWPREGRPGR